MSDIATRLPIVAVEMDIEISLFKIETLLSIINRHESNMRKHGICPECYGYLCDCECERG